MTRLSLISSFDLRLTNEAWAFAASERPRIDAHWTALQTGNPRIWNGDVLICLAADLSNGALTARFTRTDFASFVAWRDWGWPDKAARNCFGSAVVVSSDGALIYGRMGPHTLNAGQAYPPGGSLEPGDADAEGRVDVIGSLRRELTEETGLNPGAAQAGDCLAVFDGQRLSVAQAYHFDLTAAEIEARVRRHIEEAEEEELEGIAVLTSASQVDSTMPGYAAAIARYFLDGTKV
ncbi:hypothetical protein BH10PSE7_BH10PSE7_35280 [soil metagenome]